MGQVLRTVPRNCGATRAHGRKAVRRCRRRRAWEAGSIVRSIGRPAVAGVVLSLAASLAYVPPGSAGPVPWLYDVDVAVEGRTAAARKAVSNVALAEVLSRVTGLAHVPRNASVLEALGGPELYYNRFVFLDGGELRIHFVPAAILKLIDAARLPVWSSNRPEVMTWLVVETGEVRRIVDGGHPLAAPIAERARQRGLVLKLPLMDLEDRMRVQPSVVRGRLFATLEEASRRYGAEVILVGQLQERICRPEREPAQIPEPAPPRDAPADIAGDLTPAVAMPASNDSAVVAEAAMAPGPVPKLESALAPGSDVVPESSVVLESDLAPESDPVTESEPALQSGAALESLSAEATPPVIEPVPPAFSELCGPSGGSWIAGSLEAWMDAEEFAVDFAALNLQDAGRRATDFIADELAGRYAVLARESNRLALTIRGIESAVGYGRLLRYLDGLEFVTAVEVAAVEGDRLEVKLHTRAGFDQLVELFQSDGRISRDPTDKAILTWRGP